MDGTAEPHPPLGRMRMQRGRRMLTFQTSDRAEWRSCLEQHYKEEYEIWFVLPTEKSDEESISYDEVVEEALCFGWTDSTSKVMDATHRAWRFSRRQEGNPYSEPDVERLRNMASKGMLMPEVHESVAELIGIPFVLPDGIMGEVIQEEDGDCRENEEKLGTRRRIRIAYIEATRRRPKELRRRIDLALDGTRLGRILSR